MNKKIIKFSVILMAVLFTGAIVTESVAFARAGGGGSSGSRGSKSYSAPSRSNSTSSTSRQSTQPAQQPAPVQPQPASGGFMRGIAGGLMGGFLGSMLFSQLGFAGQGGAGGGGGVGMIEIILLLGVGYLIYRIIKKKKEEALAYQGQQSDSGVQSFRDSASGSGQDGIAAIRQTDPWFKEQAFTDAATDNFFKIQAAWMNRDIVSVSDLLTEQMRGTFQGDINDLVKKGQVNRLENIAVRNVEITESWQENGQDFITVLFFANLLDYTADEKSGAVVSGSKTEPVKFEEFWTFTRPAGDHPWKLSAINQA
jgi:predicted lipid-binding transport protein (Tim44 family)